VSAVLVLVLLKNNKRDKNIDKQVKVLRYLVDTTKGNADCVVKMAKKNNIVELMVGNMCTAKINNNEKINEKIKQYCDSVVPDNMKASMEKCGM